MKSKIDKERLKNPDGIYDYLIDLYSRVGKLEGLTKIHLILDSSILLFIVYIVTKLIWI